MDIEFSKKLLIILIENALRIFSAGFGINCAEGTLFEVILLLRIEPRLRSYFLARVRDTLEMPRPGVLSSGSVPSELIELAAHELRWPELLELAKLRMDTHFHGDSRLAIGDISAHIADAFDDDWEGREFYQRYSK